VLHCVASAAHVFLVLAEPSLYRGGCISTQPSGNAHMIGFLLSDDAVSAPILRLPASPPLSPLFARRSVFVFIQALAWAVFHNLYVGYVLRRQSTAHALTGAPEPLAGEEAAPAGAYFVPPLLLERAEACHPPPPAKWLACGGITVLVLVH